MRTHELIHSMLTENTGSHMCDSGGAYGRHHERNANKTIEDFEKESEEQIIVGKYGLERTVSVYHFLNGLYLDDICYEFNELNTNPNNWEADFDGYGASKEAWNYLESNFDVEVERSFNTYNGESDLSQTLQASSLTISGREYFLIQIHGGCDVRGGYTDAKLFACSSHSDGMIHEYLQEWKHEEEIKEDLQEGYVTAVDDDGKELTWEQVEEKLELTK